MFYKGLFEREVHGTRVQCDGLYSGIVLPKNWRFASLVHNHWFDDIRFPLPSDFVGLDLVPQITGRYCDEHETLGTVLSAFVDENKHVGIVCFIRPKYREMLEERTLYFAFSAVAVRHDNTDNRHEPRCYFEPMSRVGVSDYIQYSSNVRDLCQIRKLK